MLLSTMLAPSVASLHNVRAVDTIHLAYDIVSISVLYKFQLTGISPNLHSTAVLNLTSTVEATPCQSGYVPLQSVGKVHSVHVAVRHR